MTWERGYLSWEYRGYNYVLNQDYTHGGSAGYEPCIQRLCSCLCVQSYHSTAALSWCHSLEVLSPGKIIAAAKFPSIYGCSSTTERLSILVYGSV